MQPLPRAFYERDTQVVAQELLGAYLVFRSGGREQIGKIVETEAYLGEHDLAAHSARGRTARTEVMFGPAGHAYVYFIYGMHFCLNMVTEPEGQAAAVLLRALEPIQNIEGKTNGPALLCRTLGIDKRLNGCDLTGAELFVIKGAQAEPKTVVKKPRIGVDYAGHWARRRLRFYIKNNPHVSRT